MMSALSNKMKFRLLVIALAAAPFIMYILAISESFELAGACNDLNKERESVNVIDGELSKAEERLGEVTASLGMALDSESTFQQGMLSEVSRFCKDKDLQIVEFPAPIVASEEGLRFETLDLTVEGDYVDMVRLVHRLEFEAQLGRLISAEFKKVKKRSSKKEVLQLTLLIQNIQQA